MHKILPITRVIMRRVHWIFKTRRGRMGGGGGGGGGGGSGFLEWC